MIAHLKPIPPSELAFDIDGVVADTMTVFVRLARERYALNHLTKEDLGCYNLYECLDIDREVIDDLICLTLNDENTLRIPPMSGAPDVLTELSRSGPLRFVTARIWPESIIEWLHMILPEVDSKRIRVSATGSPEAKLDILKNMGIRYFVEDRIETCTLLASLFCSTSRGIAFPFRRGSLESRAGGSCANGSCPATGVDVMYHASRNRAGAIRCLSRNRQIPDGFSPVPAVRI